MPVNSDRFPQSRELSFGLKENDQMVDISGGVDGGASMAYSINRFESNHAGQNEMVVTCVFTLE